MKNHSPRLRALAMFIVALLVGFVVPINVVLAAAPPTFFTRSFSFGGQTVTFNVVQVNLTDPGTFITPYGANNRLPLYNANNPEPRWDNNTTNLQSVTNMYNGAPFSDKYAIINADYFCSGGCTGNAGAPQGMFVRDGVKRQWLGSHRRAALRFDSSNIASIFVYGPYSAPDPSDVSTYRQLISGGPVLLNSGFIGCDTAEDVPASHCGTGSIVRTSACITASGQTLYLIATSRSTPAKWDTTANFMKSSLSCSTGMDFDSGSSTGMVFQGSTKVSSVASVGTGLLVRWRSGCPCLLVQR